MPKTVAEYLKDAEAKIQKIIRLNEPFQKAVYNTVARQAGRIFIEGRNSSGGNIGNYSRKPIYINPNTSAPRKGAFKRKGILIFEGLEPTVGKFGEHIFTAETAWHGVKGTKAGDPHRTTYLPGGYKELRNRTGRRIDRMNLTLTGDLLSDYCNAKIPSKAIPQKISASQFITGFSRTINVKKRAGLERRLGKIFNLTTEEKANFFKTLDFNFRKALTDD